MRALAPFLLLAACSTAQPPAAPAPDTALPAWLSAKIEQFKSSPVANPPRSVTSYRYQDQTVYSIPADCCDQYDELFDASGKLMCAPGGGITGRGDGKCPRFHDEATNQTPIWKDNR